MRCVNCQHEVNPGGMVCPYCHGNPILFGTGPPYPHLGPTSPLLTVGLIGTILLPVFPVVGGVLLGGSVLYGLWKKVKG
jgi:hypothetical protein